MNKQNQVDMAGLDLIVHSIRVGAEKPGDLGVEIPRPELPPQNGGLKDVKETPKEGPPGLLSKVFKSK